MRARWDPGWYNLDQPLKAGVRDTFAFWRAAPPAGYDLAFANSVGSPGTDWDEWTATVASIEHHRFGAVAEVDTRPFGQYTFVFADGHRVTIEAEERLGAVNDASPGFPEADCVPAWAHTSGWALTVILTDVARTPG